jgi:hypothetical protein
MGQITFEIIELLFSGFRKYGEYFVEAVKTAITNHPYRSIKKILYLFSLESG